MIDVTTAGVTGNGWADDTAALQAVITANPEKRFYLPAGTYKITAPIALGPRQVMEGDSADATRIIQWNPTSDGIAFSGNYWNGGGVRRLMLGTNMTTWGVTFSSGIGLDLYQGGAALVEDVIVQGYQTGVQERECYSTSLRTVQVQFAKTGFLVPPAAGQNYIGTYDDCMAQAPGVASGSVGFNIRLSGGHSFKDCNALGHDTNWLINPVAGQSATYMQFIGCWADGSRGDGWVLDATAGWVNDNEFTSCWAGSSAGRGVVIKAANGNLDGVNWHGGRFFENGRHGFHLMAGKNVHLSHVFIGNNSRSADNTYDGVRVDPGVSEWSVLGCRIGNFGSAQSQRSAYGVNLSGTTANVRIQGNDLRTYGPGKAGIKNTATGSGISISNNL